MTIRRKPKRTPADIQHLKRFGEIRVPWFITLWEDGAETIPNFQMVDPLQWIQAVRQKLCWVCGKKLHTEHAFIIGPMCVVNRISGEPPMHETCALFSVKHCPFLNQPSRGRRNLEEALASGAMQTAGMITRNPGVALIWVTTKNGYELIQGEGRDKLFYLEAEPRALLWYTEAREASPAEVRASILSGEPLLRERDEGNEEAQTAITEALKRAERYLPTEQ